MTANLVEAALAVASLGFPVFPTHNKKPTISNAEYGCGPGEGGFKQATLDRRKIMRDFVHERASEIGVPTGENSNLLVVDVDLYKDPTLQTWVDEQGWLIGQRCHKTRSGGLHFVFEYPGPDVHIPAILRPGVDLKGEGGYVCWPPTPGYEVICDSFPQPFPIEILTDETITGPTAVKRGSTDAQRQTPEESWANDSGFSLFAAAGFGDAIIPIMPSDATISPVSEISPENRGKVPGRYLGDGIWVGYSGWTSVKTSPLLFEDWDSWPGAGIGIRTGKVVGVDIDVTDEALALAIEALAIKVLGPAPCRIGNPPKRLLPYRIENPLKKTRDEFSDGKTGEVHAVEILGEGQQFVAEGIHPKTRKPYTWGHDSLLDLGFDGLTEITPDQLICPL